ncbi:peptide-methionine (S)-S-oxide reductase MsrA [Pseudalkalibacillus caeni]|uniref:Peptide methionine sulfoxide reductase MsrA n=1 Tax=Exobacillus caeni TaxID=2574798 RepID=A0A5R9F522_9BACL|nr:peptide-methionine (S)-S-oxide reductase MsrA [Pseudalkalibacillus caeni]TLS37579.1 peptide-methionine (S)-S-oxide reductase MsrA [Pseudalkalibacillus caeni]
MKATFGAGCFWGVEAVFKELEGVISTQVGYMGGTLAHPTYEQVCTNETGHAEVVEIKYNPLRISYEDLLEVFWNSHNPTSLNRQGEDRGSQYRSAIFFHDAEQEKTAHASKEKKGVEGTFKKPIVTEISRASEFYRAEEYHQNYFEKNGVAACSI